MTSPYYLNLDMVGSPDVALTTSTTATTSTGEAGRRRGREIGGVGEEVLKYSRARAWPPRRPRSTGGHKFGPFMADGTLREVCYPVAEGVESGRAGGDGAARGAAQWRRGRLLPAACDNSLKREQWWRSRGQTPRAAPSTCWRRPAGRDETARARATQQARGMGEDRQRAATRTGHAPAADSGNPPAPRCAGGFRADGDVARCAGTDGW